MTPLERLKERILSPDYAQNEHAAWNLFGISSEILTLLDEVDKRAFKAQGNHGPVTQGIMSNERMCWALDGLNAAIERLGVE